MPRRHLPAFSFDEVVSANAGRQDKIEIAVEHGFIMDNAEDVGMFLHYLGSPPVAQARTAPGAFGRIFNRRRSGIPPFRTQEIRVRSTASQPLPPPLFSGFMKIINRRESPSIWMLHSLLSLNLTRFVRHQAIPRPATRLLQDRPNILYGFYERNLPLDHEDEFPLVDSDNWIPDDRLWSHLAAPRLWPRHLRAFLTGAATEVHNDLLRAAEHATLVIQQSHQNPFSMYSVETYWEFYEYDPIRAVRALEPLLETYAAAAVDAWDAPRHVRQERPENSRRLSIRTHTGETLKIYAKTNRRVRFEITHELSGNRPYRLSEGGHTFPVIEGAIPLLNHLAGVAAERVNDVLRHFRLHASAPNTQHTVLKFIFDVQAAFDDPNKAFQLLQILTHNGSLVVGRGTVFRTELRRLHSRGVLYRSHRRYSVTPPYRQALANMQQTGIGFLLGTRIRRKQNH